MSIPTLKLKYTLLCDDVRIEMGNKISLMGIFQNIMVEKLPVSLIKFAVINHWQRFAPAEAVAEHLWVALKHEITYRKPTFLDDVVIATVLLEKVQGARAFYETIIRRGEEVLAEVKSSWCCLDAETLRPARVARDVIEHFFKR